MTEPTQTSAPDGRPTHELSAQYQPGEVEQRRYESWVSSGLFTADPKSDKPAFSIVIPPPNVTGSLHIGHALDHTIQDTLSRLKRMQGFEVLWLPGMDHAGIATQNVVERQLASQGKSRHDLGREAFVDRVWQWKAESGGAILGQMRRLGDSVDWSRERFTMDEGLSRAVQTIFKRLYDDELIYRANRIINWCPRCLTALSDIEVEHTDDDGELVSIRYGDGDNSIVVATTRAETMLGDTAVAVHPEDERYQHLIGTEVELPLTGRRIPIVADEHVDPTFGTGAVKVTPAHDPNDFEIGQRHGLPSLTIMDERAVVTVPGPFEGLDRYEARPAVVDALREQGRIVAEKRPYQHSVGHCSRCKTTVEPRLSLQWFVKTGPLAQAAGDAVRDGRVAIEPAELSKRYFAWVDNMHDWCISRQLWWGHRIPIWYGPGGEVVCVGPDDEAPTGEGWRQDEDVLDTWFTLARGANPGSDVPISEEWCQGSRNFCNKLWNATRFALMNGATVAGGLPEQSELNAVDRWVLSRLQHVIAEVDEELSGYEFAKFCDTLYHFAWDDVCDWYVELSKPVLAAGGPEADKTRRVLGHVLDQLLRLLHPVIPFVTEELWTNLTGETTVVTAAWPTAEPARVDDAAEDELAALQKVVTEVRRFRSDQGLRPGQRVNAALTGLGNVGIDTHEGLIRSLARLDAPADGFTATATLNVAGGITVDLDTRGTIDVAAERTRLEKDRGAAEKEAAQCRAKLGNEAFVSKAPEQVVAKIKDRLATAEADLTRIAAALAALPTA